MTLDFAALKSAWKPSSVSVDINGTTMEFFGLGATQLVKFKDVLISLAKANAKMESSRGSFGDQGSRTEDVTNEDGAVVKFTQTDPINPDLAALRAKQSEEASEAVLNSLLSEKTMNTFASMVSSSLRVSKENLGDFEEWLTGPDCGIDNLKLFIAATLEANEKSFGEMGKRLISFLRNEKPLEGELDPMATAGPTLEEQVALISKTSAAGSESEPSGSPTAGSPPSGSIPSISDHLPASTPDTTSSDGTKQPQG